MARVHSRPEDPEHLIRTILGQGDSSWLEDQGREQDRKWIFQRWDGVHIYTVTVNVTYLAYQLHQGDLVAL